MSHYHWHRGKYSPTLRGKSLNLSNGVSLFLHHGMKDIPVNLRLKSEIEFVEPDLYKYKYTISHDSPAGVILKWGIVAADKPIWDKSKTLSFVPRKPIVVPVGRPLEFTFTSPEPPKWGIGTVVVTDLDGRLLSKGIASSYGPVNEAIIDPD